MQEQDESSSSQHRRSQLPALAPRHSQSSATRDRASGSGSTRPPRLSHRSRAGCWTCRARKVKCDEVHPKCGPCARLNRECDWDHRWNFNDATPSTQTKYSNVTTTGNAVWDPQAQSRRNASPVPRHHDDLPPFSVLTSDDERERKAETQRPGTFGVVVTPDSFADLPEYAGGASPDSRRPSMQSQTTSLSLRTSPIGRSLSRSRTDPNVVVLDRFEDVSPSSAGPFSITPPGRRPSLPNGVQFLSLSTSSSPAIPTFPSSPLAQSARPDDYFLIHFRNYILPRFVQPQLEVSSSDTHAPSTSDSFDIEAARFHPLQEAICAVSALNLSYNGGTNIETALQHYHHALSPQTTATSADELHSAGAFLLHFVLFVYDICVPMQMEEGGGDMWAIHLNHLQRIATLRRERLGHAHEPHAYLLWTICELDVSACLLGSGNCDFFRTILQYNMLPPLHQQIPRSPLPTSDSYLPNEEQLFPTILELNQVVLIQMGRMAQTAQGFRREASGRKSVLPGVTARWQATVSQLQADLSSVWAQAYPKYLGPESPQAGRALPSRVRYVFEHAFILFQAAMIYSRTSMFLGQRRVPVANHFAILADTERRIMSIIVLAASQLEARQLAHRHVIFPLFMAGFATTQPEVKVQALDIIKAYEGTGIGQNTYTTRRLLTAVYEEQRRVVAAGGRLEDVDWLRIARERSLMVVNCGL